MLNILDAGFFTTVQDGGRRGWARYGVPPSGPMDAVAFQAANALVGNPPDAAALEITLTGPVIQIEPETLIAVCGASFELWMDKLPVPNWHALYVRPGQILTFGPRRNGARAYLAVAGGLALPPYLGSQATYIKGGFGGLDGRALRPGDRLPSGAHPQREAVAQAGRVWPPEKRPPYTETPTLRVVWGPQKAAFSAVGCDVFLNNMYTVTNAADRMGLRLQGPAITHRGATGIVSDGIVTGSIQVPPNGQPIVMLVDHQTTGGYPKIATVIQADLPLLAQCLPGQQIAFRAISLSAAQKHYRFVFGQSLTGKNPSF